MYKVLITPASTAGSEGAPLCTVKKHRDRIALSSAGEDSRQHSSAGLDLSAERQEKQSADHAGREQWNQDVGHSASPDSP